MLKMTIIEWLAVAAIIIQIAGMFIQYSFSQRSQPNANPADKSPYPFANQGAKDFFRSKLMMLSVLAIGVLLIYSEIISAQTIAQSAVQLVAVGTVMVSFSATCLFWLFVIEDVLRPKNR